MVGNREQNTIGSLNYGLLSSTRKVVTPDIQPADWHNRCFFWLKGLSQTMQINLPRQS